MVPTGFRLLKDPKVEEEVVLEDTPPGRDSHADPDILELDERVGAAPIAADSALARRSSLTAMPRCAQSYAQTLTQGLGIAIL